jgi:hypothetical protein
MSLPIGQKTRRQTGSGGIEGSYQPELPAYRNLVLTMPFHTGRQGHSSFDVKSPHERNIYLWRGFYLLWRPTSFSPMAHYETT